MSNRSIEIVVNLRDNTNAKLESLKKSLDAMDKQAQRLNNRFKSFATQRYMAVLRLIDNVTAPASRIQRLLQTIAGKAYNISMKVSDGALGGIRKIESALMRIANKVYPITLAVKGNVMNKLNGLMSGAAMGAGMFMPMAGAMGVGFGVANAIQSSMGFEQEMSRVQAIRQLSKDSQDMKDMYALAKKLGMETAWTRQQVGEAMRYQALAGWETPQILKATPHMLNLASAGGMDLGAASDMLTDAMTAFGLKATDQYTNAKGQAIDLPEYFADMFAKVQASSNTDLYQLKEATKYSASTIGTMFANVEGQEGTQLRTEAARQMLIMAGLMANAGIKGSMAGTGINTIFNRLAGENRNTHFAEKLLGLEHAAANGNMIMPLDFIKAFRNKIQGGMSVDDFLQVAEELSGEKIHADTRRKINSTIENALKNGGKLGSSDMLKIGSMMAGLENAPKLMAMVFQDIEALEAKMNNVEGTAGQMAETMLDNLAGSFTKLGSAWDAFQQDLFTGTAGDGLRDFVDTLTELLTRANKLFQDGIDIGDFGKIIADVISRLKNKFLELDGIGSILAGGALVAGLMKIISLSQRAFTALKTITQLGAWSTVGTKGTGGAGLGAGAKVGTMTVSAGVVNVNGKVAGGAGGYYGGGGRGGVPGMGVAAPTTAAAVFAAQKQFDKLNSQFIAAQAKRDAKWGRVENLFAMGAGDKQLARARTLARNYDEKTFLPLQTRFNAAQQALINARVADYNAQIAQSKQSIALAREQEKLMSTSRWSNFKGAAGGAALFAGIFGAFDLMNVRSMNAERLAAAAPEERATIIKENRRAEMEAGGGVLGSIGGAALGAGIGTALAGPLGTAIGSVVGGMLGDVLGRIFGKEVADGTKNSVNESNRWDLNKGSSTDIARSGTDAPEVFDAKVKALSERVVKIWNGTLEEETKVADIGGRIAQRRRAQAETLMEQYQAEQKVLTAQRDQTVRWLNMRKNIESDIGQAVNEQKFFQGSTNVDFFKQQRDQLSELSKQNYGAQFSEMLSNLFSIGKRAEAAELTPEQMAQQAAMERGEFYPSGEMKTPGETPEVPDMSAFIEQFYSEMEALQEGVGELFSGFGEQITEQLTSAFEGAGEVFTNFGTTITEGLTTTFEGVGEMFANFGTTITEGLAATFEGAGEVFATFGTTITEGLAATFEGAGEMFTGFGEQLTASMTTAQESATTALTAIQTSFTTTKDAVQTSWAELPAFFSGVFSGLGGAAEAAGSAIHAGLTAPIGSIISAWQGAAATISSIISSISAQAAAMPSVPSGGTVAAHADGGFITSPELALIGEKGSELILPLTDKERSLDLLRQASGVLGLNSENDGYSISGSSGGENSPGGITINVGGISFEVHADNLQELENSASEKFQELADKLAAHLSEKVSTVFKNQTLVA